MKNLLMICIFVGTAVQMRGASIGLAYCDIAVSDRETGRFLGSDRELRLGSCEAGAGGTSVVGDFSGDVMGAGISVQTLEDDLDDSYDFSLRVSAWAGELFWFNGPVGKPGILRITTGYALRRNAFFDLSWTDKEAPFTNFTTDVPIRFGRPVFLGFRARAWASGEDVSQAAGGFNSGASFNIQSMEVFDAAGNELSGLQYSSASNRSYAMIEGERVVANPEPSTYLLMTAGLAGAVVLHRRRGSRSRAGSRAA